jgi:hypothetical protein
MIDAMIFIGSPIFNRVLSLELFKVSRFPFGKAASYRLFLAFAASSDCSSTTCRPSPTPMPLMLWVWVRRQRATPANHHDEAGTVGGLV